MFYSADARHERFWRVGIARNAVFSTVSWLRGLAKSAPKNGSCGAAEDRLPKMSTKFRARAIWKPKSLKLEGFGPLLEAELRKIGGARGISAKKGTTLHVRSAFGS